MHRLLTKRSGECSAVFIVVHILGEVGRRVARPGKEGRWPAETCFIGGHSNVFKGDSIVKGSD